MGFKQPKSETMQEVCDIFTSPEVVQERLLETLHRNGIPESIVERFHQYSTKEGEQHGFCWSESTYTTFLAKSYPGTDQNEWSAVAPVLYRIILHHGTYPFKPTKNTTFSLETLAIAVSLLTANDTAITIPNTFPNELQGQPGPHGAHPHASERPHNWTDRLRLLFQSLCDTDWAKCGVESSRGEGDDEDLVAVLYASAPNRPEDAAGKSRDRESFLPVAATTMPSSHSGKLDGRVAVRDVGALLKVLLTAGSSGTKTSSAEMIEGVDCSVKALLGSLGGENGYIGWDAFSKAIAEAMPFLLTDLSTLIRLQFNIEPHREYNRTPAAHSWKLPPAVTGTDTESKRSFLSVSQLCQLGLGIGRSSIDDLSLLRQSRPEDLPTSDMQALLSTAPTSKLLIIRATIGDGAKENPLVLVTKLRWQNWEQWERYLKRNDPYWIPRMHADCFVQLSPQHCVLKGSFDNAKVDVGTAENTLSIHLGGASLWFENGLTKGSLSDGADTVHFVPDLFEIWTGPEKAKRGSRAVFPTDPHFLFS